MDVVLHTCKGAEVIGCMTSQPFMSMTPSVLLNPPAIFSTSYKRGLKLGRLRHGSRSLRRLYGGGATTTSLPTVSLAASLLRGMAVPPGEDRGRGEIFATGDGCVEFTGERRCCNTALCGQWRNCSQKKLQLIKKKTDTERTENVKMEQFPMWKKVQMASNASYWFTLD